MAIKDIRSNLQQLVATLAAITGNGTSAGIAIDTADFELGFMLSIAVASYTDGTYNITIDESDTGAFAGEEVAIVDGSDKLIGTIAGMAVSAAQVEGGILPTVGVFSNLRFIKVDVVATSVTTGSDVVVIATQKGELMPVV